MSLWVIGSEDLCTRDLFDQVGRWMDVTYLDVERIGHAFSLDRIADSWRWRRRGGGFPEARICVPQRYRKLYNALSYWFCRRRFAQAGRPDAIAFTWPRLASLCEMLPDVFRIYYCNDPFEYWPGDAQRVRGMEDRLLQQCDAAFAVSRQMVRDMLPRTCGKVFYCPNAAEDRQVDAPLQPRPPDLPTGRPIVGCIGRMNYTYDWAYIRELAGRVPRVQFCFVGPMVGVNDLDRRRILAQIHSTENLLWLGPRPHSQLTAYNQHFDICFNFLRADEMNHRRSPLRLFDYLVTDRPVVSTDVREAREQLPHVWIAPTPRDAADIIAQILYGRLRVDLEARRRYIRKNTWSVRAGKFVDCLRECGLNAATRAQAA